MSEISSPSRRRFFSKFLNPDTTAPHRAAWHQVPEVAAGDGDVLWSGLVVDNTILVVGDEGRVLRYNGETDSQGRLWQPMDVPVPLPIHGVWGLSSDCVFAVGWMGSLLKYDGNQWQHLRGAVVDEKTGRYSACEENTPLFAIDGNAQGQAWVVGDNGIILHFDGQEWQNEVSGTHINLRAVLCAADDLVYAAGAEGTVLVRTGDGAWKTLDCPYSSGFHALLMLDDGSLLLAGGRYFVDQGGFRGELVLYEDGEFKALSPEQGMPRLRALKAYKGGVLIVGDQGHLYYLENWRINKLESNCRHDLMDIIPLPTGEALVVGDFGTVMTASEEFTQVLAMAPQQQEHSAWQVMTSPTKKQLWAIAEGRDGSCYACGEAGTVLQLRNEVWQQLPAPTDLNLHCIWDSGNGLYVGGQLGRIYRYDGEQWSLHYDLHLDLTILGMWGSSPTSIYAVGDEGLVLHFNGLSWQRMPSGTKSALYNLWAWDDQRMLAPGDFGLVLRYNGTDWADFNIGSENFLYDIWGNSLDNIYAVGLSGTLAHFDGQRWQQLPTRSRADLLSISGSDKAGTFIVGTHGSVMRLVGSQWQAEESGVDVGLRAVCATQSGTVYAVGDRGTIVFRK